MFSFIKSWLAGNKNGGNDAVNSQKNKSATMQDNIVQKRRRYQCPISFFSEPGDAVWMQRDAKVFAKEAYIENVVAHRAVSLIASAVASTPWILRYKTSRSHKHVTHHALISLLEKPNPMQSRAVFLERVVSDWLITGNAYIYKIQHQGDRVVELHNLRPDRVTVIAGEYGVPKAYRYDTGVKRRVFKVNAVSGASDVLHLKRYHPMDDWYGLSPVEAAAYAVDQHNTAACWNQSLLQNSARPSGFLVTNNSDAFYSDSQYKNFIAQVDEHYVGTFNVGKPILLQAGFHWQDAGYSPREMDYIELKNSSARDIALAFGVPPQLLGIPGDNTYSNLAEARLALWEQTIIPAIEHLIDHFNGWLAEPVSEYLRWQIDKDSISALAPRRESQWERVKQADFLTHDEKREMLGVG